MHRSEPSGRRLGIDKLVPVHSVHPLAIEDTWHTQSLWSIWHIEVTKVPYGDGLGSYEEAVNNPLANAETAADVERFDWPDPAMWDVDARARAMRSMARVSHSGWLL